MWHTWLNHMKNMDVMMSEEVNATMSTQIEISNKSLGGTVSFSEPQELSSFIDTEKNTWDWLSTIKSPISKTLNAIKDQYIHGLNRLLTAWHDNADTVSNITVEVNDLCTRFSFPAAKSAVGIAITTEASEGSELLATLMYLAALEVKKEPTHSPLAKTCLNLYSQLSNAPRNYQPNHPAEALRSLIPQLSQAQAKLLKIELLHDQDSANAYLTRLGELSSDASSATQDAKDFASEAASKLKQIELDTDKWEAQSKAQLEKDLNEHRNHVNSFIKEESEKISSFIKEQKSNSSKLMTDLQSKQVALSEQLKLEESVNYWNTKLNTHNRMKLWWIAALLIALIATIATPFIADFLFNKISTLPEGKPTIGTVEKDLIWGVIHPVRLSLYVIVVSVASFIIRFCSRNYSTQEHLGMEALERKTMVMTYLALLSEGNLKIEDHMQLAVSSLFRPSSTGIVNDQGGVSPIEQVINLNKSTQ